MAEPTLEPCPFCGKVARFVASRVAEDAMQTYVECTKCGAQSDAVEDAYSDYDTAAGLWNRRTAPPPVFDRTFHADGTKIIADPVSRREGDGTLISIGFPALVVHEAVAEAEAFAQAVARALSGGGDGGRDG